MIWGQYEAEERPHQLEITVKSLAVFSQNYVIFALLQAPYLGTLLKLVLYRLHSDLKALPEWLYQLKKCRLLTKISNSYFKSVQPFIKCLSSKNHSTRSICYVVWCAKDKKNPKWHLICRGLVGSLIDNVIMGLVIKMITYDNKGS